jgi:hypothetical protein
MAMTVAADAQGMACDESIAAHRTAHSGWVKNASATARS